MDTRFKDTQVLIWDFDKTLYKSNVALEKEVKQAELQTIMDCKQCDEFTAQNLLAEWYPQKTLSTTNAVAQICQIPVSQSAQTIELKFDRRNYLQRDEKLVHLFSKLGRLMHFILANGWRANIEVGLEALGLRVDIFREIVTAERVGVNKPEYLGFEYILKRTRLRPEEHLMIGDRIDVDLSSAKALGMRTCWVYWNTPIEQVNDTVADICVPTVYDLEQVLV